MEQQFLPSRAGLKTGNEAVYDEWVKKYGAERAQYLKEVMGQWTSHYTHGVLIDFDFIKPLNLGQRVEEICGARGWQFEQINGDLKLLQRWLNGQWDPESFLIVQPGQKVVPSHELGIIKAEEIA
jgi:hypothetical protein